MVRIMGRKIDVKPGAVIIGKPDGSYVFHKKISSLGTSVDINPREYALVQEGDEANSAMSMKQGFNGKNHLDTIIEVLNSGLIVPRAKRFITQLRNVNQALAGKGVLYDANGDLVEGERLSKYAHTMNHDCWVWLSDSFEPGEGFLDLNVVYITGLENGKPVFKREPLRECLSENCYAELESANEQGFLTKKSSIQKYEPGKTVYSYYPRPNMAARFFAYPGDADFGCGRDPLGSYPRLGVFVCAEGASAEKI